MIDTSTEFHTIPITTPEPAPEATVPEDPNKVAGAVVLFVDQTESYAAKIPDLEAWAEFARAHRIDTLAVKRGEGTQKWYGTALELAQEREAVLAKGCGYLPYFYLDGPKFGTAQVHGECAVLAEAMKANDGSVCVDMEVEWNGQEAAGALFEELMRPVPGLLYVTTWADPMTMNFPVRQIAACVNAWVPQDYNNYLASLEHLQQVPDGMTMIQPALDLSKEFGANNQVQIAEQMRARGHKTIWLWCRRFAAGNITLTDLVVRAFRGD